MPGGREDESGNKRRECEEEGNERKETKRQRQSGRAGNVDVEERLERVGNMAQERGERHKETVEMDMQKQKE